MKIKSIFIYGLVVAAGLVSSCNDNESPKKQFAYDNKTILLEGAKLYLINILTNNNNQEERMYVLTDGTPSRFGTGFTLFNWDNDTFYIGFAISSAEGGHVFQGEFPVYHWRSIIDGVNPAHSLIYMEGGTSLNVHSADDHNYYNYQSTDEDHSPLLIKGGLEGGEKMIIKFNGSLLHEYHNGTSWITEQETGTIYYSGTVIDVQL